MGPPFFFKMARVKNPLHSMSASGSIAGVITYRPTHRVEGQIIHRERNGKEIEAKYPPRIISGQGIASAKIIRQPSIKRRNRATNKRINQAALIRESRFILAKKIAAWAVNNNICVTFNDPSNQIPPLPPWWDGIYFQRGENREMIKFPGQEQEMTVSIKRKITGTTTRQGFVMRQLLARKYIRLDYTLQAWATLSEVQKARWERYEIPEWTDLPRNFELVGSGIISQRFMNCWIQAAATIPQFELPRGWLFEGQLKAVWKSNWTRPVDNPAVLAWQAHLNSERDIIATSSPPWNRKTEE